jgi:putative pyruvate formate lyase activating enzyme
MKRRSFIIKSGLLTISGLASGTFCQTTVNKSDPLQYEPAYLKLHQSGELKKRGEILWEIMRHCRLCPRECETNRLEAETGVCRSTSQLEISAAHPHFGEERPLVGKKGSGTIFMTNCNLRCVFCINWRINHLGMGSPRSIKNLADMMLDLQNKGCHNINLVTPTHYSPHIVMAVDLAAARGLRIPLVYNTSGWERLEILKLIDGIVDIYLPDFKYSRSEMAGKYSAGAFSYPKVTRRALLEMQRQVGRARPSANGLMTRGLMIRHLVLPNQVSGSKEIISWIASNLPKETYLNLMSQYRPAHEASKYPKISRRIKRKEYKEVVNWAKKSGLTNLDIQGFHWMT